MMVRRVTVVSPRVQMLIHVLPKKIPKPGPGAKVISTSKLDEATCVAAAMSRLIPCPRSGEYIR